MNTLDRMLIRAFVPVFVLALSFFVLLIELVDLFANLVRYLNLEVPLRDIFTVQLLFVPRAIVYALPVALLFAVGFALGSLYANNELIAIFGSGVSLRRFVAPLIVIGLLLGPALFVFQERVVIDTFARKNELSRTLLNITRSFSNTKVTVRSPDGRFIYSAEYYNDVRKQLAGLLVIERNSDGTFAGRIDTDLASWDGTAWLLHGGTRYSIDSDGTMQTETFPRRLFPELTTRPRSFQRVAQDMDELPVTEARAWIRELQTAGLEYRKPLTDLHGRFSFSLTPFVVIFISSAVGGRFKRNILLMSLLVSLVIAVVYYVTDMVAGIVAADGLIPPILGAWVGVALFTALGVYLFARART